MKVVRDKVRKIGGKAFLILAGGVMVVGLAVYAFLATVFPNIFH